MIQPEEGRLRTVPASWRIIEDVLRENGNSVFRALRKPASRTHLQRLVDRLPMPLPRDLFASRSTHDGLRDSYLGSVRLFNLWALLPTNDIAEVWTSMCRLQDECGFGGDQVTKTKAIKNDAHWRPGWIPFLDADGDKMLVDLDPGPKGTAGQVIRWSNSGSSPMRVVAPSYRAWLSMLADGLAARQFRLDEFGGIWFDDDVFG